MSEHGERAGRLRVELFGGLRASRGGTDLAVPGARLRGLLVRLALAAGRPVGAGTLVDSLWPVERPADPANALQSLVSRLRRVLGDADAVTQDEGGYRLAVGDDDVDVIRFERLAGNGRQRLRGGDAAGAAELLGAAAGLVRGAVAPEVGAVAEAVGIRLGRAVNAALADVAETDLLLGRFEVAEGRLARLIEDHPLDERVAGLLMDTLAAQGRQADALAVYEQVREEVADRLGADPGAALRERHLRLLRGSDISDLGGGPGAGSGQGGAGGAATVGRVGGAATVGRAGGAATVGSAGNNRPGADGMGARSGNRAAAEKTGAERITAERAATERAAADHAAAEGAGRERTAAEGVGLERMAAEGASWERAAAEGAGWERAAAEGAGWERAAAEGAGRERAAAEGAGRERAAEGTNGERAAAERAAGERAAAEGTAGERAEAERAAGRAAHDVHTKGFAESGPPASNLPEPLTSFIGREADLARVDDLLANGRLITVLGPGGAGKTRLATQAARRRRGEFRDGVWLIDLASVTAPAELPAAVLTATGLRAAAIFEGGSGLLPEGRTGVDVLVDQFAARECLFLVDNCEHLIDAVAHLATALLVRCPGLRILATSREPLAVDGEALVPLGPLGIPARAELDQAGDSPAVRLFAERAAAVLPGFVVDAATVADVVQIVRRLDGLPLALELAAARLRTLGLRELADGLDDRFRLLTTGSRTALPRHRTLRAVIAWSWELLGGDERIVAERVSVLPGGVTVGSAIAVCADAGVPAALIPDLLAALVDKSLLQRAPEGRYRMLETLREYGIDRLASLEILSRVRGLAAGYLSALVIENDPRLRTADQLDALVLLRGEYDNALAALRHLCDEGDADGATRLALSLVWYWQMFGRHVDAAFWLNEALRLPGERDPLVADCAEAVLTLNRVGSEQVMILESAEQRRERLKELADRLMRHERLPGLVGALSAVVLFMAQENDAAQARMAELVAGPDPWVAALAQLFRAQVSENNGDVVQVRVDVAAALEGFRAAGDRWGQATVLPLRALLRQYDGDLDGALEDLKAAKGFAGEFGSLDLGDEIFIDLRRADLHLRRGEPEEALTTLYGARARAERSMSPEMMLLIDALEAGMLVSLGELERAEELIDRAHAGTKRDDVDFMSGDHGTAIIEGVRATLALRRGDPVLAERALIRSYEAAQETRDMPILSLVAVGAAGLAELTGRHRDAAQLLGAAARLRGSHDPTDLQVAELTRRSRAVLGEEGFTEAYATGWSLDPNTALARVHPGQLRAIES